MKKLFFIYCLILALLILPMRAQAARTDLPVQGFVTDVDSGDPVDGRLPVTFKLYTNCDATQSLWSVSQFVDFDKGLYSAVINPDEDLFADNDELCLGIAIGSDAELSPRLSYHAVPYAKVSDKADYATNAETANLALAINSNNLPDMVGAGLAVSNDEIILDTTVNQTWSGSQTYNSQVVVSKSPLTTSSSDAAFKINPTSAVDNSKAFVVQDNGSDKFSVDKEGDVVIAGNLTVSGQINLSAVGDITSVNAGNGLAGGALFGDANVSVDQSYGFTWTGTHAFNAVTTFNTDSDFVFSGTENLNLTSDLAGSVNMLQLLATPSATAGAANGIVIQQQDSVNTNGLDVGLWIDNADSDLAMPTALKITGSSTGLISTALDLSDGEITTAIALPGGVNLTQTELGYVDGATSNLQTQINSLNTVGADITSVVAGNGLTGGATSGAATLDVAAGTGLSVAADSIGIDYTATLAGNPSLTTGLSEFATTGIIFEGATADAFESLLTVTDPTADRTLTLPNVSGTIVTTGDSGSVSTAMIAGGAVTTTEIAADTIAAGDIATDAVDSAEIKADAVGASELAATTVTAAAYTMASITVDADGRITAAASGSETGDISAVGNATTGAAFVDGTDNGSELVYEGVTVDTSETRLAFTGDPGADYIVTIPNSTGTIALTNGNVATATALAANGANCSAGQYPLGVDASGVAEGCTAATTGTVTSVATGTGLTGGTITGTGTVAIDYTATLAADPALSASLAEFATTGILFEGATADTIEGLLTVADPTVSDKTWTLPNTSGTIVTTGDTGSVTSTMLAGSIAASKLVGTDIATVGTITSGTWNATAVTDTYVADALTISGGTVNNSIIGGSTPAAGTFTTLSSTGTTTIGDASGDAVTANAAAWTFANDTTVTLSGGVNGLNFDSDTLSIDATNNRIGIGTPSPSSSIQVTTSDWAKLTLETTGTTSLVRQASDSNGMNFTTNALWTGSVWNRDDTSKSSFAYIQHLGNSRMEFRTAASGSNPITWTTAAVIDSTGNLGIGDVTPASMLTVGNGDLFQVNSSGNIVKINNITYSWPSSQAAGSGYVLSNDSAGTLTWVNPASTGDITSVVAGNGLTGGATSGAATVDVAAGTGLSVTADSIGLDYTATLAADPALSASQAEFATTGILFEGATADTIEGLLTIADPTASDKTWTLPNTSGTLITTGDTGTIDATMIATDAVDSAEIKADAVGTSEIATGGVATAEILDNTITATDLGATLTFADSDLINMSSINASGTAEGLILPQATDVSAAIANGQISWDNDTFKLYVGNGTTAQEIGAGGGSGDITDVGDATTGAAFKDGTNSGTELVYEGATVDTNETRLAFTGDPGADYVVTIPNTTGTVVTTGDTGTIDATMIATDAVDAAEIKADAVGTSEIATGGVATAEILDNTITATDLGATLTFADGDLINLSSINASGTAEGLILPQATDVSAAIANGQISWDNDTFKLYVGNGTTAQEIGAGGGSGDITDVGDATTGAAFKDGTNSGTELVYEGATVDTNETRLAFTGDPGADYVVTIPNRTGTVVTTGDTGTVDTTMIAADTIVAGDIATDAVDSAEIKADAVGTSEIATSGVATAEILDDTVSASDLAATLTFADSDLINLSSINASGTAEGLILPQATDVSAAIANGQISWDNDTFKLYVGNGTTAQEIGAGGGSGDITDVGDATTGAAFKDGTNSGTELVYEGATVDTSETRLAFTGDPGADYIVTIPNRTGTVVTTGDSGTVTTGMITDATIATADLADSSVTTAKIVDATIAGGDLASTIAITSTGAQDYSGASSVKIPVGTGPTIDAAGKIAVDTTDDQLVYYGGAKRVIPYKQTKCITIDSAVAADDNVPMYVFQKASTLVTTSCYAEKTDGTAFDTPPTYQLEDNSNNAVTGAATCGTSAANVATTSGNTFTADEGIRFEITNTPSPTSATWTTICFTFTEDAQ